MCYDRSSLRQKLSPKVIWQAIKEKKLNQNAFQDRRKRSPESPVSMDQSSKDTRDTSDHKCILIQNPAFKYKHYKFLKSEDLVGAAPVQRLSLKLHNRSPFKPAVYSS